MIKEDIETNRTSILFIKTALHNCYNKVNSIILLVIKYLKDCKELIESLTNDSSELIPKTKLKSPLAALLDKHTDFFMSIYDEYVIKLNDNIKTIESAKEGIDQSYTKLEYRLKEVLDSLKEVNHIYDYKYQRDIESVKEFSDERKKIQEQSINDSNDSFIKYVLSTKEKNNKEIKRLIFLEQSSKDELNKTIEIMNNTLENINNVQITLLPVYENTMSEMLTLVEKVLYAVAAVDRQKIVESFINLNEEIISLLKVKKVKNSEMTHKENMRIVRFAYKLIEKFSRSYKNVYKGTIRHYPKLSYKNRSGSIAIIEEWSEILETYIKGKLELQEKLCVYISTELKSKFKEIIQTLKTRNMPPNELEKQMCELMNDLFKFLINNFIQRKAQTNEYIKLIKVTSFDLTFNSSIEKLKYINLVDGQDGPMVIEDSSTDDGKSPKKFRISKKEDFLQENFGVSESLIESYLCALHWKWILQGRLYVTRSCLCFYSVFNNETLFGQSTRIVIPFCDIIKVKKESNALIFNNAISIRTAKSEFFFSSFMFRDHAFDLISKLHEEAEKPNLELKYFKKLMLFPSPTKDQSQESPDSFLSTIEEIDKERLKVAKEKYGLKMPTSAPYFDETYACPIQVLLVSLIDKMHPTSLLALEHAGNKDLIVESKQEPPKYFMSYRCALKEVMKGNKEEFLKDIAKWPIYTDMKIKYTHSMKEGVPIPFVPKEFTISEIGSIYYLSPNHVILFVKMEEYGLPYSDYFITHEWLEVTQSIEKGNYKTRWRVYVEIDFVKKTIFQSIIENIGLITINNILNENRIIYKQYIDREIPKFYQLINNQRLSKDVVRGWRPKVKDSVIPELLVRELGEKRIYTEKINHLLRNQRRICFLLILVIIFLILFKL